MNPPTRSKINATAALTALVTIVLLALDVGPEMKAQILTLTTILAPTLIMVFRTWFTEPR